DIRRARAVAMIAPVLVPPIRSKKSQSRKPGPASSAAARRFSSRCSTRSVITPRMPPPSRASIRRGCSSRYRSASGPQRSHCCWPPVLTFDPRSTLVRFGVQWDGPASHGSTLELSNRTCLVLPLVSQMPQRQQQPEAGNAPLGASYFNLLAIWGGLAVYLALWITFYIPIWEAGSDGPGQKLSPTAVYI